LIKLKRIVLGLIVANVLFIVLTKWINTPITTVMIGSIINGNGLTREYISYDEMGRNAKLAVVCSEDQLFPDHNGFDMDAIKKAVKYNNDPKHKKILGASTISQQTAKNVFLWNGRNWFRKGLEVYHTFMIELIWGKKRIIAVYLNIAETGKMTFGVEAASRKYYGHSAEELSTTEAARLAACLPNPIRFSVASPSGYVNKRTQAIKRQMKALGGKKFLRSID
jgi:monofunctional biosynthetic peptidoglycan transglycosylase